LDAVRRSDGPNGASGVAIRSTQTCAICGKCGGHSSLGVASYTRNGGPLASSLAITATMASPQLAGCGLLKASSPRMPARTLPDSRLIGACSILGEPRPVQPKMPLFPRKLAPAGRNFRKTPVISGIIRENRPRRVRCILHAQPTSPCSAGNIQTTKIYAVFPGVKRLQIPQEHRSRFFGAGNGRLLAASLWTAFFDFQIL
jgi:hypothetical protein